MNFGTDSKKHFTIDYLCVIIKLQKSNLLHSTVLNNVIRRKKMKKLITTMIAVMVMAFSVVPAFAVSSPVATSPAGGGGKSSDSPKTGSSDIRCGVASIALVKSAKKK